MTAQEENKVNYKLEVYLRELEKHLARISVADRSDIVLELSVHIQESLEKGDRSIDEILKALGKPEQVANRYLIERGLKPIPPKKFGWVKWGCLSISAFFLLSFIALFVLIKSFSPILKIDDKNGYVNILGGMVEVDEQKGTVKLGKGLLSINDANVVVKSKDGGSKISIFNKSKRVKGNGVNKTITRKTYPFHNVRIKGSVDVQLYQGNLKDIEITGDENLLEYISTEVKDGTLTVSAVSGISYSRRLPLIVKVTTPSLDEVSISGSSDVFINDFKLDSLRTKISGSADINMSGQAEFLTSSISGSGDLKAFDFIADSVDVSVSGSGTARVHAKKSLKAKVSGSGDVIYDGEPKTSVVKASGSGTIKRR